MGYLYRTMGVTITAAGSTITHSLSRATNNLHVLLTPRNTNTLSQPCYVSSITPNTVVIGATGNGAICDIAILEFHSIQGGPGPG